MVTLVSHPKIEHVLVEEKTSKILRKYKVTDKNKDILMVNEKNIQSSINVE